MNANPHRHEVRIDNIDYLSDPYVRVTYGDTTRRVESWFGRPPSIRRIKRAVRAVIKQHDVGSREAGKRQDALNDLRSELLLRGVGPVYGPPEPYQWDDRYGTIAASTNPGITIGTQSVVYTVSTEGQLYQ